MVCTLRVGEFTTKTNQPLGHHRNLFTYRNGLYSDLSPHKKLLIFFVKD